MSAENKSDQQLAALSTEVSSLVDEYKNGLKHTKEIIRDGCSVRTVEAMGASLMKIYEKLRVIEKDQVKYIKDNQIEPSEKEKRNLIVEMCRSV